MALRHFDKLNVLRMLTEPVEVSGARHLDISTSSMSEARCPVFSGLPTKPMNAFHFVGKGDIVVVKGIFVVFVCMEGCPYGPIGVHDILFKTASWSFSTLIVSVPY